ncbi:EF-hand domain-containing protein [Chitinophagales bacterium]|nr:EF-hand domain-containing protein [Chitinophagales bacterium]
MMKIIMGALMAFLLLIGCSSQKGATGSEGRKSNKGSRPSVAEVFLEIDTNKDGKLSRAEIKGPLQKDFDRVDTNGDGFITKTELQNAPKPERGQGPPRSN